jgi:hypothetical protein
LLLFTTVVLEDGVADRNTLIADIRAGIVRRRRDQLGDCVLRLMAERATEGFI